MVSVKVMVVDPADTPVTIPFVLLIVATEVLLLDHVPPLALEVNAVVEPTQTVLTPVMVTEASYTSAVVTPPGIEPPTKSTLPFGKATAEPP